VLRKDGKIMREEFKSERDARAWIMSDLLPKPLVAVNAQRMAEHAADMET
jgi:hypothetical protein